MVLVKFPLCTLILSIIRQWYSLEFFDHSPPFKRWAIWRNCTTTDNSSGPLKSSNDLLVRRPYCGLPFAAAYLKLMPGGPSIVILKELVQDFKGETVCAEKTLAGPYKKKLPAGWLANRERIPGTNSPESFLLQHLSNIIFIKRTLTEV